MVALFVSPVDDNIIIQLLIKEQFLKQNKFTFFNPSMKKITKTKEIFIYLYLVF
jgi:hypothetical protein